MPSLDDIAIDGLGGGDLRCVERALPRSCIAQRQSAIRSAWVGGRAQKFLGSCRNGFFAGERGGRLRRAALTTCWRVRDGRSQEGHGQTHILNDSQIAANYPQIRERRQRAGAALGQGPRLGARWMRRKSPRRSPNGKLLRVGGAGRLRCSLERRSGIEVEVSISGRTLRAQ